MMRVANKRVYRRAKDFIEDNTQIRFPYLYVILDCRQETPTVMIEDYQEVPSSLDEVVAVLTYSINMAMESKGWKVKLMKQQGELSPLPFSLRSVMEPLLDKPRTIEEFNGVDNIWEIYAKKKRPKNIRDAIKTKYIEKTETIIDILHQYIDNAETPEATVMAIRAAMVTKVMRRPTWSEFHNEFPEAKCSKSSLERLTDLSEEHYEDSKDYDALLERFGLL